MRSLLHREDSATDSSERSSAWTDELLRHPCHDDDRSSDLRILRHHAGGSVIASRNQRVHESLDHRSPDETTSTVDYGHQRRKSECSACNLTQTWIVLPAMLAVWIVFAVSALAVVRQWDYCASQWIRIVFAPA